MNNKEKSRFYIAMLSGTFLILGFITAMEFGFMSLKFFMFLVFYLLIYMLSALWAEQDIKIRLSKQSSREMKNE